MFLLDQPAFFQRRREHRFLCDCYGFMFLAPRRSWSSLGVGNGTKKHLIAQLYMTPCHEYDTVTTTPVQVHYWKHSSEGASVFCPFVPMLQSVNSPIRPSLSLIYF